MRFLLLTSVALASFCAVSCAEAGLPKGMPTLAVDLLWQAPPDVARGKKNVLFTVTEEVAIVFLRRDGSWMLETALRTQRHTSSDASPPPKAIQEDASSTRVRVLGREESSRVSRIVMAVVESADAIEAHQQALGYVSERNVPAADLQEARWPPGPPGTARKGLHGPHGHITIAVEGNGRRRRLESNYETAPVVWTIPDLPEAGYFLNVRLADDLRALLEILFNTSAHKRGIDIAGRDDSDHDEVRPSIRLGETDVRPEGALHAWLNREWNWVTAGNTSLEALAMIGAMTRTTVVVDNDARPALAGPRMSDATTTPSLLLDEICGRAELDWTLMRNLIVVGRKPRLALLKDMLTEPAGQVRGDASPLDRAATFEYVGVPLATALSRLAEHGIRLVMRVEDERKIEPIALCARGIRLDHAFIAMSWMAGAKCRIDRVRNSVICYDGDDGAP